MGELSRGGPDRGIPAAGVEELNRVVPVLGQSEMHLLGNLGVHERFEEVNWIKEIEILSDFNKFACASFISVFRKLLWDKLDRLLAERLER